MPRYVDLVKEAVARKEEAAYRRRRLLAVLRGWLRESGSPKWAATGAVMVSALVTIAVGRGCVVAGLTGPALGALLGVLVSWPLFILILWKYAGARWKKMEENPDASRLISTDGVSLIVENNFGGSPNYQTYREALARESGRAIGQTGIFGLVLYLGVSGGSWLIYDLVRTSPSLLAEIMLDGVMATRQPALLRRVETFPWPRHIFESTLPHFFGIAIAVWIVTGTIALMWDVKR